MRMIEAVVFDMDGVLIDSHPVHRLAWRKFLATVGRTVNDDELAFILEGRRREDILRHFFGDLSAAKITEYGKSKDLYFEENFRDIQLIPGVRRFINSLKLVGLRTAIATSASSARTRGTLRRLMLEDSFATIVTGDDVDVGKPDPSVYQLVSERLDLVPSKLIVFEDAPCGVEAAKSAGMRCIGVSTDGHAERLTRSGAEFVIRDFSGLSLESLEVRLQTYA